MSAILICRMGKAQKQSKPKAAANKYLFLKRYLKLLAISQEANPRLRREFIKLAPSPVLKLISNAAIYASRGTIPLSESQKAYFRANRQKFAVLANKKCGFTEKRRVLLQKGSGFFIPFLLSTVLPLLGSALPLLFNRGKSSNE